MKAFLVLILLSGVYARSFRKLPASNEVMAQNLADINKNDDLGLAEKRSRPLHVLADDDDLKNAILDSKIYSKLQRRYLNRARNDDQAVAGLEDSDVRKTHYFLTRTMQQQNLTLCHFKICNLGRKSTTQPPNLPPEC